MALVFYAYFWPSVPNEKRNGPLAPLFFCSKSSKVWQLSSTPVSPVCISMCERGQNPLFQPPVLVVQTHSRICVVFSTMKIPSPSLPLQTQGSSRHASSNGSSSSQHYKQQQQPPLPPENPGNVPPPPPPRPPAAGQQPQESYPTYQGGAYGYNPGQPQQGYVPQGGYAAAADPAAAAAVAAQAQAYQSQYTQPQQQQVRAGGWLRLAVVTKLCGERCPHVRRFCDLLLLPFLSCTLRVYPSCVCHRCPERETSLAVAETRRLLRPPPLDASSPVLLTDFI